MWKIFIPSTGPTLHPGLTIFIPSTGPTLHPGLTIFIPSTGPTLHPGLTTNYIGWSVSFSTRCAELSRTVSGYCCSKVLLDLQISGNLHFYTVERVLCLSLLFLLRQLLLLFLSAELAGGSSLPLAHCYQISRSQQLILVLRGAPAQSKHNLGGCQLQKLETDWWSPGLLGVYN